MSKIETISKAKADTTLAKTHSLPSPTGFYARSGKRIVDLVFVLCILPVAAPLIAILAILVSRDGGRPFFGHPRIGRDRRAFYCWKIRSMVPDAEQQLFTHLALHAVAKAEWDQSFKLKDDPRITPLGHFIRKTSLDELPQIWNIFKGEMSVVGPRPVTVDELHRYGTDIASYNAVRPGLTGLWQVSGRNDLSYPERVALDVTYAKTLGFWSDMRIICVTVKVMLSRTGK